MLLENMMDDKQLNFNQPLLSVRRFSSTIPSEKNVKWKVDTSFPSLPPLPYYRSELKSGPVRNPGTVPFVWEQSPGRPKDEGTPQFQDLEQTHVAPKLPPGWTMKLKQQAPDKAFEDQGVTEAPSSSQLVLPVEEKFESSKDEGKETSDSGDGDEAYFDALDRLSRTESFFLNCSLSGLSGLDGPKEKPSGTFSTDPQTRDFMMDRFLPAARAMASEMPQSSRKQFVPRVQPRQVNKLGNRDKRPLVSRHRPNNLPTYAEYNRNEESDDEHDDYDEPGNLSNKACGLLPRFCLKSSFCLLNPVPGMSARTWLPMSPISSVRTRSSSAGLSSETENQPTGIPIYEQKSVGGNRATKQHEFRSMVKSNLKQHPYNGNYSKSDASSLYRGLQGGGIPHHHNGLPRSHFSDGKGFRAIPEGTKNGFNSFDSQDKGPSSLQELFANQSSNEETGLGSPMVEKTVYVDSVHKMVSPKSNSFSSAEGIPRSTKDDMEVNGDVTEIEEISSAVCSLKDDKNLNYNDGTQNLKPVDSHVLSFSGNSDLEVRMDVAKGSAHNQNQALHRNSDLSANVNMRCRWKLDSEDLQLQGMENPSQIDSQFPLPPPLPKSPSESWLWRTLPSMSSKSSSSWKPYLGGQMNLQSQPFKVPSVDPKWETLVKTKKSQRQHFLSSEEQVTPPSEA